MEADDYKTLLKQAEEELGATPGAYCSRKAALRAMELLRAAGQVEFDEAQKKATTDMAIAKSDVKMMQQVVERQAQAIQRLEEEKTRGKLGQARSPHDPFPKDGLMLIAAQREERQAQAIQRSNSPLRDFLNPYFDNAKQF